MIGLFFAMQLASHGSTVEEALETEPILSDNTRTSNDSPPLSEIRPASADDIENLDADEETCLVNQDFPQCRICLDTGGR